MFGFFRGDFMVILVILIICKWGGKVMIMLFCFLLLWFVGDFGYVIFVVYWIEDWECLIECDENGVWEGCLLIYDGEGDIVVLFIYGINDLFCVWWYVLLRVVVNDCECVVMRFLGFVELIE